VGVDRDLHPLQVVCAQPAALQGESHGLYTRGEDRHEATHRRNRQIGWLSFCRGSLHGATRE
jgi:hypothetical protein